MSHCDLSQEEISMRSATRIAFAIFVGFFASLESNAVTLDPGDVIGLQYIYTVGDFFDLKLWHVDKHTGDRTIICSETDGTGPKVSLVFFDFSHSKIVGSESLLVNNAGNVLYQIDLSTCNRTILSSTDQTSSCTADEEPYECCTGSGTSDGTPPCTQVGSGPDFGEASLKIYAVPPDIPNVAALPAWGIALIVGILVGLSIRLVRQQKGAAGG
jgi:hypothetical protein